VSTTPRTDQLEECDQYKVDDDYAEYNAYRRMMEHSRELERELAKIKATLADPAEVEPAMIRGDIAIPDRVEFDGIRDAKA
jgi:hypothetical protein